MTHLDEHEEYEGRKLSIKKVKKRKMKHKFKIDEETFICEECDHILNIGHKIESNSIKICKRCLNELVKCNMFL